MTELHRWDLGPAEARALQQELAGRVRLEPLRISFKVLGAADISYVLSTNQLVAVIVTFQWPDLTLIESSHVVAPVTFPYIPGLLSFREVPLAPGSASQASAAPRGPSLRWSGNCPPAAVWSGVSSGIVPGHPHDRLCQETPLRQPRSSRTSPRERNTPISSRRHRRLGVLFTRSSQTHLHLTRSSDRPGNFKGPGASLSGQVPNPGTSKAGSQPGHPTAHGIVRFGEGPTGSQKREIIPSHPIFLFPP